LLYRAALPAQDL